MRARRCVRRACGRVQGTGVRARASVTYERLRGEMATTPGVSYMYRPRETSYLYSTVPELLDRHATEDPDKTAHVFWISRQDGDETTPDIKRETLSFRQLSDGSRRLASGLLKFGLQPGDRVALYGGATPEWMLVDLACLRIQTLVIRLPPSLVHSRHLVDFLVEHRCRLLVTDGVRQGAFAPELRRRFPEAFVRRSKLTGTGSVGLEQVIDFDSATSGDVTTLDDVINLAPVAADDDDDDKGGEERLKRIQNAISPDDAGFVYPTSGSTGSPKLVMLSHFSVVNTLQGTVKRETVIFNDRLFSWFGSACHLPAVTGCTHVHVQATFTADPDNLAEFVGILSAEGVHVASVPVYLLHDIVAGLEAGMLPRPSSLRAFSTSGEGTPIALRARLLRLGLAHASGYGSTETGTIGVDVAAPTPGADVRPTLTLNQGVEVKVADERGRILEAGKKGILWVRSRLAFLGYLDDDDTTARALTSSGWVNSGDLVVLDPPRLQLAVHGRVDDVISKGGVKVYPGVVEAVIGRHPGVKAAYVTGVPDDRYQEEIGACVVLKAGCEATERDLVTFCENNSSPRSAISITPRYVAIVPSLPVLPSGKIDRFKVKAFLRSKMSC